MASVKITVFGMQCLGTIWRQYLLAASTSLPKVICGICLSYIRCGVSP